MYIYIYIYLCIYIYVYTHCISTCNEGRVKRLDEHLEIPNYPDPVHYLNKVQKYFFRNEQMRHLRVGQYFRYFGFGADAVENVAPAQRTDEPTLPSDDVCHCCDTRSHRHFDPAASAVSPGECFPASSLGGYSFNCSSTSAGGTFHDACRQATGGNGG